MAPAAMRGICFLALAAVWVKIVIATPAPAPAPSLAPAPAPTPAPTLAASVRKLQEDGEVENTTSSLSTGMIILVVALSIGVLATIAVIVACLLMRKDDMRIFPAPSPKSTRRLQEAVLEMFYHRLIKNVEVKKMALIDAPASATKPFAKLATNPAPVTVIVDSSGSEGAASNPQVATKLQNTPAVLQDYGEGKLVMHTLNPRLVSEAEGLQELAKVYKAMMGEVAQNLAGQRVLLKMEPIGTVSDPSIRLPELTFAAISLALHQLFPSEREAVKLLQWQICVSDDADSGALSCCSGRGAKRGVKRKKKPIGASEACGEVTGQLLGPDAQSMPSPTPIVESGGDASWPLKEWLGVMKRRRAQAVDPPKGDGQLPCRGQNDFDWIRKDNAPVDRVHRLASFCCTRNVLDFGAYGGGSSARCLGKLRACFCCSRAPGAGKVSMRGLVEGSRVIVPGMHGAPPLPRNPCWPETVLKRRETVVTSALEREIAEADYSDAPVCLINAASAYHVGGGFNKGGRHALEEALCCMSSLYNSLEVVCQSGAGVAGVDPASVQGKSPKGPVKRYLRQDGAVLSPGVTVFRAPTAEGYRFRPEPININVVSAALPNFNPQVSDSPCDRITDPRAYEAGLARTWAAILYAAALSGSSVLLVPDIGCGAFKNDPAVVGRVFGQEFAKFGGYFERVILCGPKEMVFQNAAVQGMLAGPGASNFKDKPYDTDDSEDEDSEDGVPFLENCCSTSV